MDSKWVKVSDNGRRGIKRSRAPQFAENTVEVSHKVLSLQSRRNSLLTKLGKRKRLAGCQSKCGLHLRKSLHKNYSNLMKSGLPHRLLFCQNSEWNDFPRDIVEMVREDFRMKKAAIEVQFNGRYMIQVDLKTGSQKPIAWIDEAGSCFFPQLHSDNGGVHGCSPSGLEKDKESEYVDPNGAPEIKLHLQIEVNGVNVFDLEECVEESNVCAKRIRIEQKPRRDDHELGADDGAKMEDVVEEVKQIGENLSFKFEDVCQTVDLDVVRNMFLVGMNLSVNANVLEINRCFSTVMQSRWEIFQKQVEIARKCCGDPNVQYAWLASIKDAQSSIMTYGLASCGPKIKTLYGVGVHLTSLKSALTSANYCDADENGVRHLVFCHVIIRNLFILDLDNFIPLVRTLTVELMIFKIQVIMLFRV